MDVMLRVTSGPDQGATIRLPAGETVVGRGAKAHLKLSDASVSVEHAVFTMSGDDLFVENLSAHGTLVNETKISARTRVKPRDSIRLSPDVALRIESGSGVASGLLGNPKILAGLLVGAVILLLAVFIFDPFGPGQAPPRDWPAAQAHLTVFIEEQVQDRKLPPDTLTFFADAWRLDRAKDFKHSKTIWLKLQILLDAYNPSIPFAESSARNPAALRLLLESPQRPDLSHEQSAAALQQFVNYRLKNAIAQEQAARSAFETPD